MAQLHLYTQDDLNGILQVRAAETRLGERIVLPGSADPDILRSFSGRFVLLGIPEDIGVRANNGIGGAHTAWSSFLASFLHIQHTSGFPGEAFLLLGAFGFSDWMEACRDAGATTLREFTARIDELVYPVVRNIVDAGKIPVVIGGGHNNAYPLLKGSAAALGKPLHAVNLDAHADFRIMEGRHSGNGFRYAYAEGLLEKYAMLGLHEAYNSQSVVDELRALPDRLLPLFWEDIFLREKTSWREALEQALDFVSDGAFGAELDVDCIEDVLSSAATPVGIRAQQAMQYLYRCGQEPGSVYLHLPEGVTERADGRHSATTGKLLSYLVQAFARGVLDRS